jgi:hypothetical protein
LRLMTSENFVGCCTGRSAGFSFHDRRDRPRRAIHDLGVTGGVRPLKSGDRHHPFQPPGRTAPRGPSCRVSSARCSPSPPRRMPCRRGASRRATNAGPDAGYQPHVAPAIAGDVSAAKWRDVTLRCILVARFGLQCLDCLAHRLR